MLARQFSFCLRSRTSVHKSLPSILHPLITHSLLAHARAWMSENDILIYFSHIVLSISVVLSLWVSFIFVKGYSLVDESSQNSMMITSQKLMFPSFPTTPGSLSSSGDWSEQTKLSDERVLETRLIGNEAMADNSNGDSGFVSRVLCRTFWVKIRKLSSHANFNFLLNVLFPFFWIVYRLQNLTQRHRKKDKLTPYKKNLTGKALHYLRTSPNFFYTERKEILQVCEECMPKFSAIERYLLPCFSIT